MSYLFSFLVLLWVLALMRDDAKALARSSHDEEGVLILGRKRQ